MNSFYKTQHTVSHTAKHCSVATSNDNHCHLRLLRSTTSNSAVSLHPENGGISSDAASSKPASAPAAAGHTLATILGEELLGRSGWLLPGQAGLPGGSPLLSTPQERSLR